MPDNKYLIYMDVSGDVNVEYAKENGLRFIPMEYSLGSDMRKCDSIESDEVLKAFYDGQRNGDMTRTSQISPFMYEEYLSPALEEGYSILYLCLSSGLSSTYQSALLAKENLKEKYPDCDFCPIDTLAATGGMGVLAERALRNQKAGLSLEDNFNDIVKATGKIKHYFMVQDLMYLMRGGRLSGATAVVGTVLNVRPILQIDPEGKLVTIAKKRGDKGGAAAVLEYFRENYDSESPDDVISVIDADIKELGDKLESEIRALYPNATIRRNTLSPIIGAHTGPGMIAICFIGK